SGLGGGLPSLNLFELDQTIPHFVQASPAHQVWITAAMLLIFSGVLGKSAQFPLHVWLPDAMEGPTPVSALIHAATMVAAGVYLLARMFTLFALAPLALEIIAYIGGFTAIFAATHAIVQKDIKRILAYSTLSQLGYMVMAVGLGSAQAGMFHLTTHAFFKALLFLSAGSIIHATGEQDISQMGGLFRKMPFTSGAFLVGTYALIGFWPSGGFFSKDAILALAFFHDRTLFWMVLATVYLTALYMGRVAMVAFLGSSKIRKKPHEPSQKMMLPLGLLALFSLSSGYLELEKLLPGSINHLTRETESIVMFLGTAFALGGVVTAFFFYRLREKQRDRFRTILSWINTLLTRKYYMDELYDFILRYLQQPFAEFLSWFEKRIVVEGAVNQTAGWTGRAGSFLRKLQTGKIQNYLSLFFAGVVIVIYLMTIGSLQ
ncbi:MAG: NADH-quinone oxidoreductase subunit L, partial [Candidatus Omnitrophica bacterium]|nr:NADH-quinone oxidoreductase subunit L [Candidatus Omnitrophota bacterium]